MANQRDWDPGEPAAFSYLYKNYSEGTEQPEHPPVTWLQALRIPFIAAALGVFLSSWGRCQCWER